MIEESIWGEYGICERRLKISSIFNNHDKNKFHCEMGPN